MKVIDLGPKCEYRWRVEIPFENKTPVDDFRDWLSKTQISAAWVPGLVFFREEKDLTCFLLRWS